MKIGSDPVNAQPLSVVPGKYTVISGFADPDEAGAEFRVWLWHFCPDYYVVNYPAGLELNQISISGESHDVDFWVLEQQPGNPGRRIPFPLTGTDALTGPALSCFYGLFPYGLKHWFREILFRSCHARSCVNTYFW